MKAEKENIYLQVCEQVFMLGQCVLEKMRAENSEIVGMQHSRASSVFSLSKSLQASYRLPLYHSAHCPAQRFTTELGNLQVLPKKVPIVCSIILKSSDNSILISRKTEYMSIYEKHWSFPCNKVQAKESVCKAGLRGLREDTGVNIFETPSGYTYNNLAVNVRPICMYESVFPRELEIGLPRNQVLVVFYEATLPCMAREIVVRPGDVDLLVWLSREDWINMQNDEEGSIHAIGKDYDLDFTAFKGISPNSSGEGISEGHFIALSLAFGR